MSLFDLFNPDFYEEAEPHVKIRTDGDYQFLDDWHFMLNGRKGLIRKGYVTDGSSWRAIFPGPERRKIARSGFVHDTIWQMATFGQGGEPCGFWEGNLIWFQISISGTKQTRCPIPWAIVGWIGLTLGGWVSWLRYRREEG